MPWSWAVVHLNRYLTTTAAPTTVAPTTVSGHCLSHSLHSHVCCTGSHQGFPDDFHLATLDTLLTTCSELQPGVKVFLIMSSLMDRLAAYAQGAQQDTPQGGTLEQVAPARDVETC